MFFYRDAMVRVATASDAEVLGRMLWAFNREYDEPSPPAAQLASRFRELLPGGETVALLAGDGPDGFAVLRFRPSLYTPAEDCYLAELYVAPDRRGNGLGRAMMDVALSLARDRGADHIELTTSHDDVAARGLYESLGFTNREGRPDGPLMYYYERDL